jgi:fructosamine-3-kinase
MAMCWIEVKDMQITKNHLAFVEHAARAFEANPLYETFHHPSYGNLVALRSGEDRDCVNVYELGDEIANFVQQMEPCPTPRKVVREFGFDMEAQLKANEHKGGWSKEHWEFFTRKIQKNFDKLINELEKGDKDKYEITILCANLANFSMMIADNEGEHL